MINQVIPELKIKSVMLKRKQHKLNAISLFISNELSLIISTSRATSITTVRTKEFKQQRSQMRKLTE